MLVVLAAIACLAALSWGQTNASTGSGPAQARTASGDPAAIPTPELAGSGSTSLERLSLPFPTPRGDRRPHDGEAPSLYADGLACSIGCRPVGAELGWPLRPFHHQHPLRAGLNELRPESLHVGLDIQATDGAPVYAVQPGVAQVLTPIGPNARVQVGRYIYWHIVPAVRTGQLVRPFSTVLGRVMAGYGHIAFSEVDGAGSYVNPLRPEGTVLEPYSDHASPAISRPAVSAGGQVVVSAYSPQSFVRFTSYVTPVLAPAALAYRLYDSRGLPVTSLEWAFRGTHLLPWSERWLIYAPGAHAPGYVCFASKKVCVPHWSFRVAGGLAPPLPAGLPEGHYRLTVYAWDWADNRTARDLTVRLTGSGWRPVGHVPAALFRLPGYYSRSRLEPGSGAIATTSRLGTSGALGTTTRLGGEEPYAVANRPRLCSGLTPCR